MKISRLLFILAILIICSSEDPNTCPNKFQNQLEKVCSNINAKKYCTYFGVDKECYPNGCENADYDSCSSYLPDINNPSYNIHTHKCEWSSTLQKCTTVLKTCNDYNKFAGGARNDNGNDKCTDLIYAPTDSTSTYSCIMTSSTYCGHIYSSCSKIPADSSCGDHSIIASDLKAKCEIQNVEGTLVCRQKSNDVKTCSEFSGIFVSDKTICKDLKTSDASKYSCIYYNGYCQEIFTNCVSYMSETACNAQYSIPAEAGEYKYSKKCFWDDTKTINKCTEIPRKCNETINDDVTEDRCGLLESTDPNKICVVKSNNCVEEYDTCKNYNDNAIGKNRNECQYNLFYLKPDENCEYHFGEDQCIKKTKTYTSCSEYNNEQGQKDRIVCESIRLPNSPFYCVFDKDNQCVERELLCSETFKEEDCLHIAKASDPNKKCAFNDVDNFCYEEYIRCEDYIGTDSDNCTDIRLYNGLQCEFDSDSNSNPKRCRTRNKFCQEARTEEECKLIAKTGVSDPERKVCDYIGNTCKEIFKYCSDYRGTDPDVCKEIKPYEFEGEKLDKYSKCELETATGKCQRVPKDCKYGNDNPILCNEISPNIKDNLIKYCRYNKYVGSTEENKCIEDFKTCDAYKETSDSSEYSSPSSSAAYLRYETKKENCEKIIPKGYQTGLCIYKKDDDNIYKCVAKDDCINFQDTPIKYQELCYQGNSTCTYDSNECYEKEMSCEEIRFYEESDNNEKVCQDIDASEPYKICTIKEDKSGCKEVYRELSFSTAYSSYSEPPGTKSEESSNMIKGINMITILLFLLF